MVSSHESQADPQIRLPNVRLHRFLAPARSLSGGVPSWTRPFRSVQWLGYSGAPTASYSLQLTATPLVLPRPMVELALVRKVPVEVTVKIRRGRPREPYRSVPDGRFLGRISPLLFIIYEEFPIAALPVTFCAVIAYLGVNDCSACGVPESYSGRAYSAFSRPSTLARLTYVSWNVAVR